jgi:hypothetical protein
METSARVVSAAGVDERPARTFEEILSPLCPDRFLEQDYGQRPVVVRGWPGKLEGFVTWADINRCVRATHLEWLSPEMEGTVPRDRILATVGGRIVDPKEFFEEIESLRRNRVRRLQPARLATLLRRRATLLIRELDHLVDGAADLAAQLERDLGDPVAVAALASFTPTPGLNVHIDEQDSLILQIEGRKHWRVWEPTRAFPVHNDVTLASAPTVEPILEVTLEPGDVAYVPRGWFHSVRALDGATLHLTVNIYKRTGVDLLASILRDLCEDPVVRKDLPRHGDDGERAERGRALLAAFAGLVGDGAGIVDRYIRQLDREARPRRPTFSLPWTARSEPLPDHLSVRLLAPRGLRDIRRLPDGTVRFVAQGREWEVTEEQLAVLGPLLGGSPATVDELRRSCPAGVNDDDLDCLLRELLFAGLLAAGTG